MVSGRDGLQDLRRDLADVEAQLCERRDWLRKEIMEMGGGGDGKD